MAAAVPGTSCFCAGFAPSSCCSRLRPRKDRPAAIAQQRGGDRGETRITLERQATVISYGEAADGIVTTARRSADAASSDQVLVAFLKENYTLERLNGWDAFGMRGTCSAGFKLWRPACASRSCR